MVPGDLVQGGGLVLEDMRPAGEPGTYETGPTPPGLLVIVLRDRLGGRRDADGGDSASSGR